MPPARTAVPRLCRPGPSDGHLLARYRSTSGSPCSHCCLSMVVLLLTRARELVIVGPRSPLSACTSMRWTPDCASPSIPSSARCSDTSSSPGASSRPTGGDPLPGSLSYPTSPAWRRRWLCSGTSDVAEVHHLRSSRTRPWRGSCCVFKGVPRLISPRTSTTTTWPQQRSSSSHQHRGRLLKAQTMEMMYRVIAQQLKARNIENAAEKREDDIVLLVVPPPW